MTTLLFTTSMQSAPAVPPILTQTLGRALGDLDDGRSVGDLEVIGAVALFASSGFRSSAALASYRRINGLIMFGSTADAFGMDDLEEFHLIELRIRQQAMPIPTVRLPGAISRRWLDYDTHLQAAESVKAMLAWDTSNIVREGSRRPVAIGMEEFN